MLVVTADHGMVVVPEHDRVDFDTEPSLQDGVRMLGGEARVRHVYTEPGSAEDVLHTWQEVLGERAWILSRDQAVEAGWFGPQAAGYVRPRIGDLVVAAQGSLAVVRSRAESRLSGFIGHHGSLTAEEQLIPLLDFQRRWGTSSGTVRTNSDIRSITSRCPIDSNRLPCWAAHCVSESIPLAVK